MSLSHLPEDQWPDECRRLYAQLAAWIANVDRERPALRFDGTISSLIEHFERHDLSPYQAVKYNSRDTYDDAHRLLRKTVGARQLSKLAGIDFLQWEENLKKPAEPGGSLRVTRSHKTMCHLRRLLRWGVVLELPHCQRLTAIISQMDFEAPQVRSEYMTFEQAAAIIEAAHEQGRPSIALGQALQFELMLRQKDVIGEWITDTSMTAGIRHTAPNSLKPKRWDNGLLWSHIDADMILTKLVTKTARTTRAVAQFDLKLYPLVMAELARIPAEKRIGPVVINEYTRQPYTHDTYRELWRSAADLAGVPRSVQNRDSRAGGITEATDSGAGLELVRHSSTHKNPSMTARYSKGTLLKTREVAAIRVAARKKPEQR